MLVGTLLTVLTLAVMQFGLDLLVRNTLLDAAAEGARYGSLAGSAPGDGARRTRELITTAIGGGYARDVSESRAATSLTPRSGAPAAGRSPLTIVTVTVRAPLPVVGLIGAPGGITVHGHGVMESLGD
ncbi:TadE family protein [Galbitalea soli]|uniref:TadE family protein n=1 Tax=Galbitalea soli TaxID=1268042 RepID=UPI0030CA3BD7